MGRERKSGCFKGSWCLLAAMLCFLALSFSGGRAKAASQSISLGTQGGNDILVKRGEEVAFSLNTTEEASVYYGIREEIASVS